MLKKLFCLPCFLLAAGFLHAREDGGPRLIVLTDIGGDPDDQQSMVRLLLYANELEIEGLIASASGTPGELGDSTTKPHLIREIVEAYGKVRPRLVGHAAGYPPVEALLSRIRSGNSRRGRQAIGEDQDTEGSRWIVTVGDRQDSRPVNIAIWGGQTDLAQALWRVRRDRGAGDVEAFVSKLRVHDIADQDGLADWITSEFPSLFYVLDRAPAGRDRREAAFRGMYLGGDQSLTSREWIDTHIRRDHGPLGALYPPRTWTAPNPHSALKEGDTPSWFYFLPHGLNDPAHPEWGGWGGRYTASPGGLFRDAEDSVDGVRNARATVWRWRPAFQADFRARLDWCVAASRDTANHAPRAVLQGNATREVIRLRTSPGDSIRLSAEGSHDPDGNALACRWWHYPEASTFAGKVSLRGDSSMTSEIRMEDGETTGTVHVILEIRDDGEPALVSYRRAVITVSR